MHTQYFLPVDFLNSSYYDDPLEEGPSHCLKNKNFRGYIHTSEPGQLPNSLLSDINLLQCSDVGSNFQLGRGDFSLKKFQLPTSCQPTTYLLCFS